MKKNRIEAAGKGEATLTPALSRKRERESAGRAMLSPKTLLLPYQRKWVDDASRFKIGVWSRQTGKSFSTASEAVEDCIRNAGSTWVCLSAGERQALEWLGKVRDWASAYKLVIENYLEDREAGEALLKAAEARWANGSRIIAIPANPKTARGYSANIVLDEFAYHEDPDKIWAAMFPSISNPLAGTFTDKVAALMAGKSTEMQRLYKVRVVSTFNGRGNKFFDLWEKAEAKKNPFSFHKVTIEDAVRDGLPLDIEELRAGLDDAESFAQEYMCVPLDGSNVLLPYELIALAESADATAFNSVPDAQGLQLYAGVDFGRQNDPTVCWLLQRMGDTLVTREVLVLKGMDVPSQQDVLRSRIRMCQRVSFDYTGPGIGLGDYLARDYGEWKPEKHQFGKMELCTFSQSLKRDIFPKMRKAFEAPTRLRIPISRNIREDLHAMQQTVHNGQYDYTAPHTKEGHSDRCTALALAVRAAGDGYAGIGAAAA